MELRDAESGDFLILEPIRYEFPDSVGVEYDSDWLIVRGWARSGADEWRWTEPSLLVGEAEELADWMAAVARAEKVRALEFIEPNLAFDVASADDLAVDLVVLLGHESSPPSRVGNERHAPSPVHLRIRREDLAVAALELRDVMRRFPSRE